MNQDRSVKKEWLMELKNIVANLKDGNMNIYIVANFTNSETSRFFELARLFASRGYNVTVITTEFDHEKRERGIVFPSMMG